MKTLVLTFFAFFVGGFLFAQNSPWAIRAEASTGWSYANFVSTYVVPNDVDPKIISHSRNFDKRSLSKSGQIAAAYSFSEKISVSMGFGYSIFSVQEVLNEADSKWQLDPRRALNEEHLELEDFQSILGFEHRQDFHFISLPVNFRYNYLRKETWRLFCAAGPNFTLLHGKSRITDEKYADKTIRERFDLERSDAGQFMVGAHVQTGIEHSCGPNWNYSLSVNYNAFLKRDNLTFDTFVDGSFSAVALSLGIGYTFGR